MNKEEYITFNSKRKNCANCRVCKKSIKTTTYYQSPVTSDEGKCFNRFWFCNECLEEMNKLFGMED